MATQATVATKEQTIAAGEEMLARSNPAHQENHKKVIAWIKTLKNVPSTSDPNTTYKECVNEWYAVFIRNQPNGTGRYNLETVSSAR